MASTSTGLLVRGPTAGEAVLPAGTTGATPTLNAASLTSDPPPPWTLTGRPLTPLVPTPGREKKTPPGGAEANPSPKVPKVSDGDVTASRTASLEEDEAARLRLEAEVAVAAKAATGTAASTSGVIPAGDAATGADGDESESEEEEDDDDESEEDDMLARMAAAARQRAESQQGGRRGGVSSNPTTPQAGRRGSLQAPPQSAPPGLPLPRSAPEEGWDSVERRRMPQPKATEEGGSGGEASGGGAAVVAEESGGKAPTTDAAAGASAGAASAVQTYDDDDDGYFDEQYSAAKDGSRRVAGKHSRSVRQTVQREHSIAVRDNQRSGGRR